MKVEEQVGSTADKTAVEMVDTTAYIMAVWKAAGRAVQRVEKKVVWTACG